MPPSSTYFLSYRSLVHKCSVQTHDQSSFCNLLFHEAYMNKVISCYMFSIDMASAPHFVNVYKPEGSFEV